MNEKKYWEKSTQDQRTSHHIWTVTRCERTESSPPRDANNSELPLRSRIVIAPKKLRLAQTSSYAYQSYAGSAYETTHRQDKESEVPEVSQFPPESSLDGSNVVRTRCCSNRSKGLGKKMYVITDKRTSTSSTTTRREVRTLDIGIKGEKLEKRGINKHGNSISNFSKMKNLKSELLEARSKNILMEERSRSEKNTEIDETERQETQHKRKDGTRIRASSVKKKQSEADDEQIKTRKCAELVRHRASSQNESCEMDYRITTETKNDIEHRVNDAIIYSSGISGILKKKHVQNDLSFTLPYDDRTLLIDQTGDIDEHSLQEFVNVYHSGLYDEKPATTQYIVSKNWLDVESEETTNLTTKLQFPFRHGLRSADYPISDKYDGGLENLLRRNDVEYVPAEVLVERYHCGVSDQGFADVQPTIDIGDLVAVKARKLNASISDMFRRKVDRANNPSSPPYVGRILLIDQTRDTDEHSLQDIVSVYHSGIYDEKPATTQYVESEYWLDDESEEKTNLTTKPQIPFKHDLRSADYPISHEYDGRVESLMRKSEVEYVPVEVLVERYHCGVSDQGFADVQPTIDIGDLVAEKARKLNASIADMFRRKVDRANYPSSTPYVGRILLIDQTRDIDEHSLQDIVNVYHSGIYDEKPATTKYVESEYWLDDESEEKTNLTTKPQIPFKHDLRSADYPISDEYDGRVESLLRKNEVEYVQVEVLVERYHCGVSDQGFADVQATIDIGDLVAEKARKLNASISDMFRRKVDRANYPSSPPYVGRILLIDQTRDIDEYSLQEFVNVYHSGIYDEKPATTKFVESEYWLDDESKEKTNLTTKPKIPLKHDLQSADYPISDKYDGGLENLLRRNDVEYVPVEVLVERYHCGVSDQGFADVQPTIDIGDLVAEKARKLNASISDMFRRKVDRANYPSSSPYVGRILLIDQTRDIDEHSLQDIVNVYHSGIYDEKPATTKYVESEYWLDDESEEKTNLTTKPQIPFKHDLRSADYPISHEYDGRVESLLRKNEVEYVPVEVLVERYHCGVSDQGFADVQPTIDIGDLVAEKARKLNASIADMFRRKVDRANYPSSTPYVGRILLIDQTRDIDEYSLQDIVKVYHSGIYDEKPATTQYVESEYWLDDESEEKTNLTTKPQIPFKHDLRSADYPISHEYDGRVESLLRKNEVEYVPVEVLVERYHCGVSDQGFADVQPTIDIGDLVAEKARKLNASIADMFRRKVDRANYPSSTPYVGRILLIDQTRDIDEYSLQDIVNVYHSGIYDEKPATTQYVESEYWFDDESEEKTNLTTKPQFPFRHGLRSADYPISDKYDGGLENLLRRNDVEYVPVEVLVERYHCGVSDQGFADVQPTIDIGDLVAEKARKLNASISDMFRSKVDRANYPSSSPYVGRILLIDQTRDIDEHSLQDIVNVYHSGIYDEKPATTQYVESEYWLDDESEEKTNLTTKPQIPFKHDLRSADYPISHEYDGRVESLLRKNEVEYVPVEVLVERYHCGVSDQGFADVQPTIDIGDLVAEKARKLNASIADMFRRKVDRANYPSSTPYVGRILLIDQTRDIDEYSLQDIVNVYHSGIYDEKPATTQYVESEYWLDDESEEKTNLTTKPQIPFKHDLRSADYPISHEYDGRVESLLRKNEVEYVPVEVLVERYHCGVSDQGFADVQPTIDIGDLVAEKARKLNASIADMFRRKVDRANYPSSTPYVGRILLIDQTRDIDEYSLQDIVNVYHSGIYDEKPATTQYVESEYWFDDESEEKTNLTTKPQFPFRHGLRSADYPISDKYDGGLENLLRRNDVEYVPVEVLVERYHCGVSDQGFADVQPTIDIGDLVAEKARKLNASISDMFRSKVDRANYPSSSPYVGRILLIDQTRDIDEHSLQDIVNVYHSGIYDEKPATTKYVESEYWLDDESEEKTNLTTKPQIPFKHDLRSADYPISHEYDGRVESLLRKNEVEYVPVEVLVERYHCGVSDQGFADVQPTIDIGDLVAEKARKLNASIADMFRRKVDRANYPSSTPYVGRILLIDQTRDIDEYSLQDIVNVYHSGIYDEKPATTQYVESEYWFDEESEEKTNLTTKPQFPFRHGLRSADYPISDKYDGGLENLLRRNDVEYVPVEVLVERYHCGVSDQGFADVQPTIDIGDLVAEKARKLNASISDMFRSKVDRANYPSSSPYVGRILLIDQTRDIDEHSLQDIVNVYHSGIYDEKPATTKYVESEYWLDDESEEKTNLTTKPQIPFKHDLRSADYPISHEYDGRVENLLRRNDVEYVPVEVLVERYHCGVSDQGFADVQPTIDIGDLVAEKARKLNASISDMFRSKVDRANYPSSSPYVGRILLIDQTRDIDEHSLQDIVNVYHSGIYDEKPATTKYVESEYWLDDESEEKTNLTTKPQIPFKHDLRSADYPISHEYDGRVESLLRKNEVEYVPVEVLVERYHCGVSDQGFADVQPTIDIGDLVAEKARKLNASIADMFRRKVDRANYPSSTPYVGRILLIDQTRDIDEYSLQDIVNVYHSGIYDEKPATTQYVESEYWFDDESEEKTNLTTKPQFPFRHGLRSADYPISDKYDGGLENLLRRNDVEYVPVEVLVERYHCGVSDQGFADVQPTIDIGDLVAEKARKLNASISDMFRSKVDRANYPSSSPYVGRILLIDQTRDIDEHSLQDIVNVYHSGIYDEKPATTKYVESEYWLDDESEEKTNLTTKPQIPFKHDLRSADYPISHEYDGRVESLLRKNEVEYVPVEVLVERYHCGVSDQGFADVQPTIDIGDLVAEKARKLNASISDMFRRKVDRANYPSSPPYVGRILLIDQTRDIDEHSLQDIVNVYHSCIYDEKPATAKFVESEYWLDDESKEKTNLTTKPKIPLKHDLQSADYPISDKYDGGLENLLRRNDVEYVPVEVLVERYHCGVSDQGFADVHPTIDIGDLVAEKARKLNASIADMFRRKVDRANYPSSTPYVGRILLIDQTRDIDEYSLQEFVKVYHSGIYDEKPATTKYVESEYWLDDESEEKTNLTTKPQIPFKHDLRSADYPISDEYDGRVESLLRKNEVEYVPVEVLVERYHCGVSDQGFADVQPNNGIGDLVAEKARKLNASISDMFRRKVDRANYPSSPPYVGRILLIDQTRDIDEYSLQEFVNVYHSGIYDEKPATTKFVESEYWLDDESEEKTNLTTKPQFPFRHGLRSADYPISDKYDGGLENLLRRNDVEYVPVEVLVERYHCGVSDPGFADVQPTIDIDDFVAEKTGKLNSSFADMFRRKVDRANYPSSPPYVGRILLIDQTRDIDEYSLQEFVNVYHSGIYDEKPATTKFVESEYWLDDESKEKTNLTTKPKIPLKHDLQSADYPISDKYDGGLENLLRRNDVEYVPVEVLVERYHCGVSDQGFADVQPTIDIGDLVAEKARKLNASISDMFRRKVDRANYPSSPPYVGRILLIDQTRDIDEHSLQDIVNVYHSGIYDEKPATTQYVESENWSDDESEEKTNLTTKPKIPLKHDLQSADYPISDKYDGGLENLLRRNDVEYVPVEVLVERYHGGVSDQSFADVQPTIDIGDLVAEKARKLNASIADMFRMKVDRANYPSSPPYVGRILLIDQTRDIDEHSLQESVNVYHSGIYDEKPATTQYIASKNWLDVESEETTNLTTKLQFPFRHDLRSADYPISDEYDGCVGSLLRKNDVEYVPVEVLVERYHCGVSDQGFADVQPTIDIGDLVAEKARKLNASISDMFRRKVDRANYPSSPPYVGRILLVDQTRDIDEHSLQDIVNVYHSGIYDEKPATTKSVESEYWLDDESEQKTNLTTKLQFPFRHGLRSADYPISDEYDGCVGSLLRKNDVEYVPVEVLVERYHCGVSDQGFADVQPTIDIGDLVAEKARKLNASISDMFRRKVDRANYPSSPPYVGRILLIDQTRDIDEHSLQDIVNVYHSGIYDEKPATTKSVESEYWLDDESEEKTNLTTKLQFPFRHGLRSADYPISDEYDGCVGSLLRKNDVEYVPVEVLVERYHCGVSDQGFADVQPTIDIGDLVAEKARKLNASISDMFRRKVDRANYPSSPPYVGRILLIDQTRDIDEHSLQDIVNVYHSGIYDEKPATTKYVESEYWLDDESEEKTNLTTKLQFPFRHGLRSADYPISDEYDGCVGSLLRKNDVEYVPVEVLVERYHCGVSDQGFADVQPTIDIGDLVAEKARKLNASISDMFRRKVDRANYPSSPPYVGRILLIDQTRDIDEHSLQDIVNVYHSGIYDEKPATTKYVESEYWLDDESEEKTNLTTKLQFTFRHGLRSADYPISDEYDGCVGSLLRKNDVEYVPVEVLVERYHCGVSDQGFADVQPTIDIGDLVAEKARKLNASISDMFRRKVDRANYPSSPPYVGRILLIDQTRDIDEHSLQDIVNVYHSGIYDEKPATTKYVESEYWLDDESEEKTNLTTKLQFPFRHGLRSADYPISDEYDGCVGSLLRKNDVEYVPVEVLVERYHCGVSDQGFADVQPTIDTDGFVAENARKLNASIADMFRRKIDRANYPSSPPYVGRILLVDQTRDIDEYSLQEFVNAYHSGIYDGSFAASDNSVWKFRLDACYREKSNLFMKLRIPFSNGLPCENYPCSDVYAGDVKRMNHRSDIEHVSVGALVSRYHSGFSDGRYDVLRPRFGSGYSCTDLSWKCSSGLAGFFKFSASWSGYPLPLPYDGRICLVDLVNDIEYLPLDSLVRVLDVHACGVRTGNLNASDSPNAHGPAVLLHRILGLHSCGRPSSVSRECTSINPSDNMKTSHEDISVLQNTGIVEIAQENQSGICKMTNMDKATAYARSSSFRDMRQETVYHGAQKCHGQIVPQIESLLSSPLNVECDSSPRRFRVCRKRIGPSRNDSIQRILHIDAGHQRSHCDLSSDYNMVSDSVHSLSARHRLAIGENATKCSLPKLDPKGTVRLNEPFSSKRASQITRSSSCSMF